VAVTDLAITLAAVLKWEAAGGDVLLADGGLVRFDPGGGTVTFTGDDARFGTIVEVDVFETGVGDRVESGSITFAPAGEAAVSSWWRTDLENSRMRIWVGEIDPADGVSLTGAELVADWLVDTTARDQEAGSDLLKITFMTRLAKLFELRQGNVCSDSFHRSIWAGERGFENCTDAQQFFAWGAEAPPAGRSPAGGGGGGGGGGFGPGTNPFPQFRF
jgi:hypothetical protein